MNRQPAGLPPFRISRGTKTQGEAIALHAHEENQLIFAVTGTLQVYTETGRWLVPPQLAVWAPAGVAHRIDVLFDTDYRLIHWSPSTLRVWAPLAALGRAFALGVTPLLRELVFAAFAEDITPAKIKLVIQLILHEMIETPDAPTFLPLPASTIGRRVADMTLADERHRLDIADLAAASATSVRTISRLFPIETGLTFKTWRQRARIIRAIECLSVGARSLGSPRMSASLTRLRSATRSRR